MKNPLEKIMKGPLDKLQEMTGPGTRLHFLHRLVEAQDTFLRNVTDVTRSRVHVRDALDAKRLMFTVVVALIPAILFAMYNIGMQKLTSLSAVGMPLLGTEPTVLNAMVHGAFHLMPQILVTYMVGGIIEVIFSIVRNHEVSEGFLVTGMLIPLTMPPDVPLWMLAVGTAFGIIFGKEIFGGVGYNFLNPALTARAFIFFSYPTEISGDLVWRAVRGAGDKLIDGYSGATALAVAATAERGSDIVATLEGMGLGFWNLVKGTVPGSNAETSVIAILIGAAILIFTGVGSWRVMAGTLLGGIFMGVLFNVLAGPESLAFLHLPWYYHLVMGGFAFGMVFMTTDPVSAAATARGKWIYGFFIGVLAILIRVVNPAYPEGMMLAILFMNVFAPIIDHFVIQANIRRRLARVQG